MDFSGIRVATNSFSWHPDYNTSAPPMSDEELVAQAAEAGAEGLEIDPERVSAELLARHGIVLSGASTGGSVFAEWSDEVLEGVRRAAEGVAQLGGYYLFFTTAPLHGWGGGWGEPGELGADVLKLGGERMSDLGRCVAEFGLDFAFHNHAAAPEGLAVELALLHEHTDPAYVKSYLDIGWAYASGGDPVTLIRDLGPRLGGFHLRNQYGKVPAATLAEGDIDMAAVVAAMKDVGYSGWVALELYHPPETPVTQSMLDYQKESLAYLRGLLA